MKKLLDLLLFRITQIQSRKYPGVKPFGSIKTWFKCDRRWPIGYALFPTLSKMIWNSFWMPFFVFRERWPYKLREHFVMKFLAKPFIGHW